MKKTKKFYATLVLTAFAMIAMLVGIYAVLNNVAMQASGNITYKAFGCDVKVVGQISNAVKESADGSLFYNNKTDYLEDMESFIGANDGWTIGDISFDYESSLEIKPIIITLDVYNYSIHPIFATLNIGAEFQQIANASNVDITAKVDSQDYVLGSEFYIAEATFDASKTFVSYTHRIFEITISVDDDSTNMEMASRITLFEMLFEKTLRQYDNYYVLPSYVSAYENRFQSMVTSTFSGWAGSIGAPELINNIRFRVGARDTAITQINVLLAETDKNGTLVASETLDVKIDANTDRYIIWSLSNPIENTEGKSYYFGYTCNQFCNMYSTPSTSENAAFMSYTTDGQMLSTFSASGWTLTKDNSYKKFIPVTIGEVLPVIEYQDRNFAKTSSTYTGELKANYTSSTFSGWGGSIGKPSQVSALRFRVGARDNAITAINMFITEENNTGKVITGVAYSINIEANTYKDIVWKLSNPITNNTKNLYFAYTCNEYCNYYEGKVSDADANSRPSYIVDKRMGAPSEFQLVTGNSGNISFMFSIDIGEIYTNPSTGEEEDTPTGEGILQTVDVHLANSYDLVVGDVFQMFYRGVIRAVNPYNYYIKVVCAKGNSFPRFWQWTPTESDVGAHSLSIKVLNDNGQLIGEDTTTLNVVNPMQNTTYATAKNILCVGDSLTAAAIWFKEGYRRFCSTGGTPAGLGNTDSLNFIGTKSVTVDGKTVGYEGVGGWSWATYLGSNSPFYNTATSSIDFVNYCTTNGFAGIDEVYFLLTWNGFGSLHYDEFPTDTSTLKNAQTLIDILKTQFPNVKVTCLGIPLSSLGGGTGTNYGTNSIYGDAYGIYMTAFAYNIALEKLCLSDKYSSFVRYVDTKAQFDGDYNYPTSDVPVNSRNPQTETIQSNGVHPNQYGYLQIGDAFYRALCSRYKAE